MKEGFGMRATGWLLAAAGLCASTGLVAQQPASPKPKSKIICKRSADTGSLIAKRKECHTREEWDQISQAARENVTYEMERNMGRPPGGP